MKNIVLFLVIVAWASSAHAQTLEANFKRWNIYTLEQDGDLMCYMAGAPAKSGGTFKKRGQPYLIVTDRGVKADEISASAGYPLKSATLELDGKATPLMTENDIAWAHDLDEDMKLVGLLKRKGNVTLRGVSQKGTISDDSYALAGFEQAYDAMKALCQ